MGGLGPGIGGSELIVIGLVALLVVGPKDLPLLMRRVGQAMAKARAMANDFRASFDEMARQSELDDLRKEVEALRRGQGMHPLGDEAAAAFKDINQSLNAPTTYSPTPTPTPAVAPAEATSTTSEWPDPASAPAVSEEPVAKAKTQRKRAAGSAKLRSKGKADDAAETPKPRTTAKVAARRAVATPAVEVSAVEAPAEPKPKPTRKPRKTAAAS
jgi:sec-independent protein translocase protein TatB